MITFVTVKTAKIGVRTVCSECYSRKDMGWFNFPAFPNHGPLAGCYSCGRTRF